MLRVMYVFLFYVLNYSKEIQNMLWWSFLSCSFNMADIQSHIVKPARLFRFNDVFIKVKEKEKEMGYGTLLEISVGEL